MTAPTDSADAAIALVTKHLAGLADVRALPAEGIEARRLAAALTLLAVDIARAGEAHGDRSAAELVQEVAATWQARKRRPT